MAVRSLSEVKQQLCRSVPGRVTATVRVALPKDLWVFKRPKYMSLEVVEPRKDLEFMCDLIEKQNSKSGIEEIRDRGDLKQKLTVSFCKTVLIDQR